MADHDVFENGVSDGDTISDGWINGCYNAVKDTSTGHDHDGTDSKRVETYTEKSSGTLGSDAATTSIADMPSVTHSVTLSGKYLIIANVSVRVESDTEGEYALVRLCRNTSSLSDRYIQGDLGDSSTTIATTHEITFIEINSLTAGDDVKIRWQEVDAGVSMITAPFSTWEIILVWLGA